MNSGEPRVHHNLFDAMVARANHAILRLKTEYASLFKAAPAKAKAQPQPTAKPAPKLPTSWAEARAQGHDAKSIASLLRETKQEGWEVEPTMAHDESRGLSDEAIMQTKRQGQARKPYVPGSELDTL